MSQTPLKAKIITLGCAKNEVDSEEIAGVLSKSGYQVDASEKNPDVVIINTCGFLEASKQESIEEIKKAVRKKGHGKVIVAGCLSQRMGQDLLKLAPGADTYIGVGHMGHFDDVVQNTLNSKAQKINIRAPHHQWADVPTRARVGKPWSAYLKLSEGCDHTCTFCTIPSFRGKHVSKPIERVLEEAKYLARCGVKELNLIAQDVTQYGYDLYKKFTLPKLLRELNSIDDLEWIRLLYFYPSRLTDEVIEAMATLSKVTPYIDIPLQHSHKDVLRRMRRPGHDEKYLEMFRKLRVAMPECAIRTTFIVGFPGETDAEFQSLISFVKEARLDRVGAFIFSREPGTPSYHMPDQVSNKIKKQRYDQLMTVQQEISLQKNQEWVDKSIKVLIDDVQDGWLIGRSHRDAPEIDGYVFVQGNAKPGQIILAKIDKAEPYDLYATQMETITTSSIFTPLRTISTKKPL